MKLLNTLDVQVKAEDGYKFILKTSPFAAKLTHEDSNLKGENLGFP